MVVQPNFNSTNAKNNAIIELDKGKPIIVAVRLGMSSDPSKLGHFMVLKGYNSTTVFLNDPGLTDGQNKQFSWATLLASWSTQGYAVVLIPIRLK